jgi:hypothetical protein
MYIHNVEMHSGRYKYNNVANMDSMMMSGLGLKLISMPLFTVCVVKHTQTSSITVFVPEGSRPCALYWFVLCSSFVWTILKTELFICRVKGIKRVPKMPSSD